MKELALEAANQSINSCYMDSRTVHNLCLSVHRGSVLNPGAQEEVKSYPKIPYYDEPKEKKKKSKALPEVASDPLAQSENCSTMSRLSKKHTKPVRLTFSANYDDIAHSLKYEDKILNQQVQEFRKTFGDLRSTHEPKIRLVQGNWPTDNSVADALFEEQTRIALEQSRREAGLEDKVSSSAETEDEDWEMVNESKSDTDESPFFQDESGSFVQLRKSFRAVLLENNTQPFLNTKQEIQLYQTSSKQPFPSKNSKDEDNVFHTEDIDGDANLTGMPFEKYVGYRRSIANRRGKRRRK